MWQEVNGNALKIVSFCYLAQTQFSLDYQYKN